MTGTHTIVSVSNPRWDNEDHTSLTADVVFEELADLGPLPFTANADDPLPHVQEVWTKALAGDYGEIAEYVAPSPEEVRAAYPSLTARQLRLGLIGAGISLSAVETALAAIPEAAVRERAQVEWEYASEYHRTHPLVGQLALALGLSDEQVDDLWTAALSL